MDPRGRSGESTSRTDGSERPRRTSASELPPPPPWGAALSELVSKALVPRPKVAPPLEELEIELDVVEEPPAGLRERLLARFAGDRREVEQALAIYRGCYRSLADYAAEILDDAGIPEWLWPYIDVDAIGRDLQNGGAVWVLEEPEGARSGESGLHVFAD
ncbi:MAG: antirestriction protein ArdA [Myxococcales bacterium]|nr:antirestriction protein ArdA [Myxococcales bacterium]MCB9569965.1 antirestriction protein ArdA [Myxococcales bacterium]MCB9706845.1 antirestriction protein ArdA [Myxococcales bacterium]